MSDISLQPARVRLVEIGDDAAGQRIDNYLMRTLKGAPRALVYRILRKGEVRVNKGRVTASYRLQRGDSVRIPPVRVRPAGETPKPSKQLADTLEQRVLYEDKGLIVLNKPSGLAVHGGSGLNFGVIEALRALRPDAHYLELVHRLDRETSGCLMIAKKRSVLRALHEALRGNDIDKRYLALMVGEWQGGRAVVEAKLLKNQLASGERIVRVHKDGKAARTEFTPRDIYRDACLAEVKLETGRTHQIRVHSAYLKHPLAGDDKYGDAEANKRFRALGLKRLFLHAHSLTFLLPQHERPINVTAPLDAELAAVLDRLEHR